MKIICISDTHNKHEKLILPGGDCIVHAGDFTEAGTKKETMNFLEWFSSTPYKHKILIAGNHDFYLQKKSYELNQLIPTNIHYLEDSGVTIGQVNFWGSPYTPGDTSWAFTKDRGKPISKHWDKIPKNTNVLITHSPPFGILDELDNKTMIGCKNLAERISELNITHHIFGHVHNDYGTVKTERTTYINSSSLDKTYRLINPPIAVKHR
ncbi:Icc-related predicted phosphoesterase [Gillisia sp. Hel_I_86]|uniref:metallophosphoesterase family protein n=1 Tax=Gillisia sp. Hel_I_86 TaxID=1249981 RepID=UPI001198F394|nr:metallophosphatase domain-containing protein [Gillisia sp. Hel_I_86]TVZ25786.1 Icc-related predicted phosphoesterase [Gillisia sp. Hel_I_86]